MKQVIFIFAFLFICGFVYGQETYNSFYVKTISKSVKTVDGEYLPSSATKRAAPIDMIIYNDDSTKIVLKVKLNGDTSYVNREFNFVRKVDEDHQHKIYYDSDKAEILIWNINRKKVSYWDGYYDEKGNKTFYHMSY